MRKWFEQILIKPKINEKAKGYMWKKSAKRNHNELLIAYPIENVVFKKLTPRMWCLFSLSANKYLEQLILSYSMGGNVQQCNHGK